MYDPNTMPPVLTKAHAALDSAVDKLYRKAAFSDDAARTAFLFELYLKKTEGLLAGKRGRM
ncbi:type IIL restriction-modification enzyme MmeI [Treponema putidum]|uniref:type IIL restriction-modification enzyme MmeI n=1 Tax=Treponema putidum TaxID=221027 RepID=UPI003D90DD2F